MSPSRAAWYLSAVAAAAALLTIPDLVSAQDKQCTGSEPSGGVWIRSAEQYFKEANQAGVASDRTRAYRRALESLQEGFEKQSDNPRNYLMAGEAYLALGDFQGADTVLDKAVQLWSCYEAEVDTLRFNAAVEAFNAAVKHNNAGETQQAVDQFERAHMISDQLPQPALQLALHHSQQANLAQTDSARLALKERAIDLYKSALEAAAESRFLTESQREDIGSQAAFNLAQLLAFEGRYGEAAEAYRDFLRKVPGSATAQTNLAVVLSRMAEDAREEAESVEAGPKKDRLLARADSLEQVAKQHYSELLSRQDLAADEYHNVGIGLQNGGLLEEATIAYQRALELEPYRPETLRLLGLALFAAERYDTLVTVAESLVERYPANLDNLALLANAYSELEQSNEALAVLEEREALAFELGDLALRGGQGAYTISGYIENRTLDAGTPVRIRFDLYDDAGDRVASETVGLAAPEPGTQGTFSLTVEPGEPISGLAYAIEGTGTGTGS